MITIRRLAQVIQHFLSSNKLLFRGFTPPFLCSSPRCTRPVWQTSPRILFHAEEKRAHEHVQRTWERERVLGVKGAQFAMSHAIRTSNHEINVALTLSEQLLVFESCTAHSHCHDFLFISAAHAFNQVCQTQGDWAQFFDGATEKPLVCLLHGATMGNTPSSRSSQFARKGHRRLLFG